MVVNNYTTAKKLERWVSSVRVLLVSDFMFSSSWAQFHSGLRKMTVSNYQEYKKALRWVLIQKNLYQNLQLLRTIWFDTVRWENQRESAASRSLTQSHIESLRSRRKTLWERATLSSTLSKVSVWTSIIPADKNDWLATKKARSERKPLNPEYDGSKGVRD